MVKRYYFLLFLIVSSSIHSQSNLNFNKIEIPEISTNETKSLFIDINGFNWISTDEGLNRFDGIKNTVFRSNPFDNKTISNNISKSVFQVNNKGVFVSTSSGLDYFDYKSLEFKRIESKSSPTSHYYYENYLFIPTEDEGLFIYEINKDSIIDDLKFDPRNPLSISSSNFSDSQNDNILMSLFNGDSTLWIGTSNGLNRYNLNTGSNKRFYSNELENSIPSNFIYDIYSYDSLIFIGTDKGIATINKYDNSITRLPFFLNKKVYNLFEIAGNLLVHDNRGIFKIQNLELNEYLPIHLGNELNLKKINKNEFVIWNDEAKTERIFYYNNEFNTQMLNEASNFIINDINNFKGAYYLSTNDGIIKISEDLNNIIPVYDKNEKILAVVENDFFRVLMTDENIFVYEEEEILFNFKIEEILKDQDISNPKLLLDEDEYLYIGTNKLNVINLYDEDDIKIFESSQAGFNSILSGDINNLEILYRNNVKELWISLSSGISILNLDKLNFENYKFNQRSSRNKFPNGFSSILISKKDELWITNSTSGLYKYNPETLELLRHYIFNINDKKSITSSSLTSLTEYNDELYIGSEGDGIFIYQNDSTGFSNVNTESGLLSNNVKNFLKTYQFLFILTDKGINYFDFEVMSTLTDGNNNNLRNINEEDGLIIEKILNNGISFYNDFIYFFTQDNIQRIDLYNLFVDRESPILSLTMSEYIDENFDKRKLEILDKNINLRSDISNIELTLSSPTFYKPQSTQIFYKIEELNDQWVNLGNENKLIIQSSGYSNSFVNDNKILAPYGEYNLRIKSTNSSGVESSNQLEYNLSVTPPWYLTTIAFISYFLIIVGSIFTYVRFSQGRTRRLMEEKRKEEELEEAHNLQMGLLAKENPKREDLDISTFIRCATEVGGDYYDFIEFEDGSLLAICGDATGHGTASGMMVSITKAGLLGIDSSDPNFILKTLNKIIKKVDIGRLRMSLNLVHFQNGSMKMSSAAMPPMYHFEKKKNKVDEITISNLPLGGLMTENFTVMDKKFSKDDVLVMISDGLPEAPNKDGELLDYAAVKDCIEKHSTKTASEIKDELVKLSDKWMNGIHNPDDITIVVCKKLKN